MEILAIISILVLVVAIMIHRKPRNYRIRRIGNITYAEPREEGLSLWGRKK